MITFPNAKINLGLSIVERRADGYHNLETVFYPVPLTDVLEIVPSATERASLTCYGRPVNCPVEKNLVMKAFRLMERECGVPPVEMHLYKHIPDGAGLGGGSSDASHVLLMLNEMFELGLSAERLAQLAATLGADCPFFIYNRPMMATGIGDVLRPVNVDLSGYRLVIVKPRDIVVPTALAYSRVEPAQPEHHVAEVTTWDVEQWDGHLVNDFEPSVFAQFPRLWAIKLALLQSGAVYAAMSGSGAAMFGLFKGDKLAEMVLPEADKCDIFEFSLA